MTVPQVGVEVGRPGRVAASRNLIQLSPWPMLEKAQRAITPKGQQGDSTDLNTY